MMMFEATVRVQIFGDALADMLRVASLFGVLEQKTVVVFSIDDRTHNPGSLHPHDLAIDFDVLGNGVDDLKALYTHMRVHMPAGYDVIFEGNHVHVECDRKRPNALAAPAKPA